MPPPTVNFEKLKDLLLKLKGVEIDVSTSGALAASLDRCVVGVSCPCQPSSISQLADLSCVGPQGPCIQYLGQNHGHSLYVVCPVFLLRECPSRHVRPLRPRHFHLDSFHEPHPSVCR